MTFHTSERLTVTIRKSLINTSLFNFSGQHKALELVRSGVKTLEHITNAVCYNYDRSVNVILECS